MDITRIKPGMYVAGKRVKLVTRPVCAGRRVYRMLFIDGTTSGVYAAGQYVDQVKTRLVLSAGPVAEGWFVASKPKVRVSNGKWAGESASRHDKLVANGAAFSMFATASGVRI